MKLLDILDENFTKLYKTTVIFDASKDSPHPVSHSKRLVSSANIKQKIFDHTKNTFFRFLLNPYEYLTLNTVYKFIGKHNVDEWNKLVESSNSHQTLEQKHFALQDSKFYVNDHLFIPVSGSLSSIGDKRYQYNDMFNELHLVSDKKQICLSIQVYGPWEIDDEKNLNLLTDIFEMMELHKKSDYKNVNLYVGKPISWNQDLTYRTVKYNVNRFLNSKFKFHENRLETMSDVHRLQQFIGKYQKRITIFESRFLSKTPKFYPDTEQRYVQTLYLLTYIVLNNLEKDGTFILDTSTFYETETKLILFILSEHFRKTLFYFGKLEGIYTPKLVFRHFKGCHESTVEALLRWLETKQDMKVDLDKFKKFSVFVDRINDFIQERYELDSKYITHLSNVISDSRQNEPILKFNIDKTIRYCVENQIEINRIYNDVSLKNLFRKADNSEWIARQLFPNEKNVDFRKLKITLESTYSVTPPKESDKIIHFMQKYIAPRLSRLVITDATSNAGGNTLSFSKYFRQVNSVEIDKETFDCLQHNMKLYGRDNITFYNKDYTQIMTELKQDVVFIDPPWGGILYKYYSTIDLYLSQISLHSIIKRLVEKGIVVCCKVPYNYDFEPIFQEGYYSEIIIKPIRNYKVFIVK